MCFRSRSVFIVGIGVAVFAISGCSSTVPAAAAPPPGNMVEGNRQSLLQPGPLRPVRAVRNPAGDGAETIEAGKRLFNQFNCSGCHAAGGGAIGPALMDDQWIYGSSAANIFWTIIEGRPGGMPAFGGKMGIDATKKWPSEGVTREFPKKLVMSEAADKRGAEIWKRLTGK